MTRSDLTVMAFVLLISRAAHADVFDVPYEHPVLSIAVPASWNPNHSEDGVDAAAPDNTVFFSIYTSNADSIAGVQQESLAILTRNGMKIARQRAPERSLSFAGLDWTENQYSATEDGKPKRITLDAVHLSGKKFVQLLMWGSPKGMEMNSASLKKIFNTIKLKNG